jgi:hypothetical protein
LEISSRIKAVAVRRKVQSTQLAQNKPIGSLDIAPLDRDRRISFARSVTIIEDLSKRITASVE